MRSEVKEIIFEFDEEVWEVFFFLKGFVIVFENEV